MLNFALHSNLVLLCPAVITAGWPWWRKWQKRPENHHTSIQNSFHVTAELISALIKTIPDPAVCKDGAGHWLAANESAKELFKLHEVDWYGKTCKELATILPESRHILEHCQACDEQAWDANKSCVREDVIATENGRSSLFETCRIPVFNPDGQREMLVTISRAISKDSGHHQKSTEESQRDTLIREVHHRIKNNLQGITGVLRLFAENHPETAQPITEAIGQVQSISTIHGLKMNVGLQPLHLCGLISAIAANNQTLWKSPILFDIPACKTEHCQLPNSDSCRLPVNETEAVPLALVLNELITNAVKHGNQFQHRGAQVAVELKYAPASEQTRIEISNLGQLPPEFDFDCRSGIGTGLQLVSTLLPRNGASLTWQQQGNTVVTSLHLTQPVIYIKPSA
jgi:two-component sensor histidine kinase